MKTDRQTDRQRDICRLRMSQVMYIRVKNVDLNLRSVKGMYLSIDRYYNFRIESHEGAAEWANLLV